MPHAELNGARIHYTDTGGVGAAIVLSHGLLFSGEMFEAQVAHFKDRFRVITFDHRGQGQSGVTPDGYDMETLAEDAAALIEHLGVGPCHFVGLSMGGFVGMRLAARRPDLIATLTLLDSSAEAEPDENKPKYRKLNFVARWIGLWAVSKQVMPIMFGQTFLGDDARRFEARRWRKALESNDRIGISRAVNGVIERAGCLELLAQIALPVGIGVGDEDVATVPAKAERICGAIEGAELVVFQGAGHSASIETPDQVNELIEQTVARVDG